MPFLMPPIFVCVHVCILVFWFMFYVSTFVQCVHMRVKTNQPWVSYLKAIHFAF